MKKTVVGGIFAGLALTAASQAQVEGLSIAALQEFGALSNAHFGNNPADKNEWVDHFGAFVSKRTAVNDRLVFNVGLGGIFQFQKREIPQAKWGGSQFREFYIGPTVADLNYLLGDVDKPWGGIQFGMFPYKYSQSSNLGEYLFRSGPYPSFLWTGGYVNVNSASAQIQGLRFAWTGVENLAVDVILNAETTIPPLYDYTLTALAKYEIADGLLEIGGAVQFKRLLSIHPDSTRKENQSSSYFKVGGKYYSGYSDYYDEQRRFWQNRFQASGDPADSVKAAGFQADLAASTAGYNDSTIDKNYYTAAGTVLMATASLDAKKLVPWEQWGANDLELYAEIALLGVKNYPIFYENRMDRMPVMVGFNIPTLKFLDRASLEVEWFGSPWINSYGRLAAPGGGAVPQVPGTSETWYSEESYNDITDKDNLSWSLLLQKKVAGVVTISGQVARDHARFVSRTNWFGPNVDPNEALIASKDWYWMLQFAFGI